MNNNKDADEIRVNYWLNYLSDIDNKEEKEYSPAANNSQESPEDSTLNSEPVGSYTGLGDLGEILLGNSGEGSSTTNEFDLLQEILVKPEMIEFRDRIGHLEQKYEQLENRNDAQEFAQLFLPLMSKLLNRKLAKLKQEIVGELAPLIERLIEEQYDRDKSLSIRVIGVQKDANEIE